MEAHSHPIPFICVVGVWIMRHGVNLVTHLQFKTLPKLFEHVKKSNNKYVKRATQILAKRDKSIIHNPTEVKALCKQVVAVSARINGSPNIARRQMFAMRAHFGVPCVLWTINPLETRRPLCWKLK